MFIIYIYIYNWLIVLSYNLKNFSDKLANIGSEFCEDPVNSLYTY